MLPGDKGKATAFKTMIYSLFLLLLSILPIFGFAGGLTFIISLFVGIDFRFMVFDKVRNVIQNTFR